MPRITELRTRQQEDGRISTSGALIVLFKSPRCGYCVTLTPIFEALSDKYPHIDFATVDTSKIKVLDLKGVPTMAVYKNGQCIDVIIGANEERLEQAIAKL